MNIVFNQPKLFYCKEDESSFFRWLESISAFQSVRGTPKGLDLSVNDPIDRESLYTLIGLFTRYGIDPQPLKTLCHPDIESWFTDKIMYWHEAIFGD